LPGVREVHAVDAAGVHPLLLALGSERYTPYRPADRPQELLTQASAILGQGQLSLAKYLWIINSDDEGAPASSDTRAFFEHTLRRVDWRRDLHFQTCTTIDTLDYSGDGLNQGSKLIIAASGRPLRDLATCLGGISSLPKGLTEPRVAAPGVLVVHGERYSDSRARSQLENACDTFEPPAGLQGFPLIVVVDDSDFAARTWDNFLWMTFTRSNPATDVYGLGAFTKDKHFGCRGSLVIDARQKPHHAPGLMEAPETLAKVDARATRGDALASFL
jgi:4-hydroxy-3-polyprenylbenzoate decarboxylase